jgi:predicted RND superfamily exporter protein
VEQQQHIIAEPVQDAAANPHNKIDLMEQVATLIVKYRTIILLLFIAVGVYCALSVNKVKISSDVADYLPEDTATYQGLVIMADEFKTYASTDVMVANISYERALDLAEQIAAVEHVTDVTFNDTSAHYNNSSALFSVSFDGMTEDDTTEQAFQEILALTSAYDTYTHSDICYNYLGDLTNQMVSVVLIVAAVIVAVLLVTSRCYFEVVIFLIVFGVAALLNLGTNYWLGTISALTNAVAVVLQLALAIDYAIILSHRYQDELEHAPDERTAMVSALSAAIVEISSSSLTTISGMVALTLMQFRLGYDMGVVLSKGIVCSMLTVFLLMPGLLLMFREPLRRTRHGSLVPSILRWGNFLMHSKSAFVALFLVLLVPGFYLYQTTEYSFTTASVSELTYNARREAMHKITDTFGSRSTIAILVPEGNFDKEKALLFDVEALDNVESVTSLATYEVTPGHYLTDMYTPQMLSDLLDIDSEQATLVFIAYGAEHEDYQAIFGDSSSYKVPLVDIVLYLFEKVDQGIITPTASMEATMTSLRGTLERGIEQSRGETWDRLVLTATLPAEGEESYALLDELQALADQYYGEGNAIVIGDVTSARDFANIFTSDSLKIDLLTALFVFIILLLTFRTLGGALVLVGVIQSAVWFNFAILNLSGMSAFFVTNTIVSALQMGATIDYAIVLMSRYEANKKLMPIKDAMAHAVDETFTTVLTSGTILTAAGFMIAARVKDLYVAHIGLAIGRGSLISICLVMTVLPQLLVLLDKFIEKTRFTIRIKWIDSEL